MDALSIAAASGLRSRMDSLEMLANNLANAATDGFKVDREGYGLYLSPEAAADAANGSLPTVAPVVERHWTDFAQGVLRPTGNPLDLALSGRGFFAVNGPSGLMYTRNGSFRLAPDGQLTTPEGYRVRARGGAGLRLVSSEPPEVSPDGTLRQRGQLIGQLELVEFRSPASLAKAGNSYFRNPDPAQAPTPAAVEVRQGHLESSNVNTAEAAVRLIGIMRQFEMLQKAITLGADMNRKAIEEVAHVGQ
ncbi:MAG TPA: flagellar hook basal-body protein [Bryobacteraceae bacterium]|nr:flagellar hook basal-body protein [Bryobacteraceae bacterium]